MPLIACERRGSEPISRNRANLIQVALCVLAIVIKNERSQDGFALFAVLYQLAQAVRFCEVVE